MFTFRKPAAILLMILALFALLVLACKLPIQDTPVTPVPTEIPATREARLTDEAVIEVTTVYVNENYIIDPEVREKAMANPDEKIIFTYEGGNQPYHTGLRNKTVFFIDYTSGVAVADEEARFDEPSGELIRSGTDSVKFNGWYHSATNTFKGNLSINTQGTAKGTGDQSDWTNTVTYTMNGELMVWKDPDGKWTGNVKGTATLKQSWPSGSYPDVIDTHNINWEIIGTPVD